MPEAAAPETSGAARSGPTIPGQDQLSASDRRRANLRGVPLALAAIAVCAALGLLIRTAVFAA